MHSKIIASDHPGAQTRTSTGGRYLSSPGFIGSAQSKAPRPLTRMEICGPMWSRHFIIYNVLRAHACTRHGAKTGGPNLSLGRHQGASLGRCHVRRAHRSALRAFVTRCKAKIRSLKCHSKQVHLWQHSTNLWPLELALYILLAFRSAPAPRIQRIWDTHVLYTASILITLREGAVGKRPKLAESIMAPASPKTRVFINLGHGSPSSLLQSEDLSGERVGALRTPSEWCGDSCSTNESPKQRSQERPQIVCRRPLGNPLFLSEIEGSQLFLNTCRYYRYTTLYLYITMGHDPDPVRGH